MSPVKDILAATELKKDYPGPGRRSPVRAVDGVSFTVRQGECLGLVGESGSGKTTTARIVVGLEKPDSGAVTFEGVKTSGERHPAARAACRRMQMIFQDPYESLNPGMTVSQLVAEPLRIQRLYRTTGEMREAVITSLESVDLEPASLYMNRHPHQLSGGQRQRVAIARALVSGPSLVVADEPTSMLDVSVRAGILALLSRLQQERNLSLLFITHDWTVARVMCSRVAVMYAGQIVESGRTEDLIADGCHPYTRALVAVVADLKSFWANQAHYVRDGQTSGTGCLFAPRCPRAVCLCYKEPPDLVHLGDDHWVRCHLS
ncbi:MAG: ABC transporter ATP-binding protein [Bacillota bacterium]